MSPPGVILHPLPNGYILAIGKPVGGYVGLTAMMPASSAVVEIEHNNYEDFEEETCKHCKYYFDTYDEHHPSNMEDDDGNPAVTITYSSCCPCHEEGLGAVDFPCVNGHDEPSDCETDDISLPGMAYRVILDHRGWTFGTEAWMQNCDPDTQLFSTRCQSINCYNDHRVCWGRGNEVPTYLPEIVEQYIDCRGNEDLLSFADFQANVSFSRASACEVKVDGCMIGAGYDCALLVSAAHQSAAYLLLRASGYPAQHGLIALGLTPYTAQPPEGEPIEGFITPEQYGLCWFIAPVRSDDGEENSDVQGQLLAQIPYPFPACSSTTPSSSELAAVAAS